MSGREEEGGGTGKECVSELEGKSVLALVNMCSYMGG